MGFSVLELVLQCLREKGFHADVAYPGQKFPQISDVVAAVHLQRVDRASLTVTVEVNVICPGAMGGTACEVEALKATDALRWAGGICVQNGCSYDGISQVYMVPVLATFTGIASQENFVGGPGFAVTVGDVEYPYVVSFTSEETEERQPEYAMGESEPMGFSRGQKLWKITLEELIPAGSAQEADPDGDFELRVSSAVTTEVFHRCRFLQIRREHTREGLRRIRTGYSMLREEV